MAFLKLPDKDKLECLDYTIDFSDLIPAGTNLVSATATIESGQGSQSPTPSPDGELDFLTSPQAEVSSSGTPSPNVNDQVTIWLGEGITGQKYVIRIDALDDEASVGRCYTRRVEIKIKDK